MNTGKMLYLLLYYENIIDKIFKLTNKTFKMFKAHILNVGQQCYKISNQNKTESEEKETNV